VASAESQQEYRKVLETVHAELLASARPRAERPAEAGQRTQPRVWAVNEIRSPEDKWKNLTMRGEEGRGEDAAQKTLVAEFRGTLGKSQGDVQKTLEDNGPNYEGKRSPKVRLGIKALEETGNQSRPVRLLNMAEKREGRPGQL